MKSGHWQLLPSFLLMLVAGYAMLPDPVNAADRDPLSDSMQLIVVTTPDWNSVEGKLQRFERGTQQENWRPVGERISIVVGKNGMGWGIGVVENDRPGAPVASDPVKKEGDGKAPAGIFALGTAFGSAAQPLPQQRLPYLHLTSSIECVDDVDSTHYNRIVDRSSVVPDWKSSEHMSSVGELYSWGIVVNHNGIDSGAKANPPAPGGGSCVFLHIWRSAIEGTAGCTAMPRPKLETLLTWLDPKHKPLLVQLPEPVFQRFKNHWNLPTLPAVHSH